MTQGIEARCSGCQTPIKWRFTPNGKSMPLETTPHQGPIVQGCYVVESQARCRPADPLFDQGKTVYMAHWANCPNAHHFRASEREKRT